MSGEWEDAGLRIILKAKMLFVSTYITSAAQLFTLSSDMDVQVCDATKA